MPLYESCCRSEDCPSQGIPVEWYTGDRSKPDPNCPSCGQGMRRMISAFGVVFTGPLSSKYLDHKSEVKSEDASHWVWETRNEDGQKITPRPRFLTTFQEQREYCKREGVVDPSSIGPAEVGSDGKTLSSRGMPGCW